MLLGTVDAVVLWRLFATSSCSQLDARSSVRLRWELGGPSVSSAGECGCRLTASALEVGDPMQDGGNAGSFLLLRFLSSFLNLKCIAEIW